MKKILMTALVTFMLPTLAQAEVIATMPNEGGGFIVFTDDQCKYGDKVYKTLNRTYSYTAKGNNFDGCYGVEDNTVVVIWFTKEVQTMRYPISSLTFRDKKGVRYGT